MERQCYDGAFQKLAVSTIQCFARALQLNHDNVKLWIEYACSAYQLHSFASRVLKSVSSTNTIITKLSLKATHRSYYPSKHAPITPTCTAFLTKRTDQLPLYQYLNQIHAHVFFLDNLLHIYNKVTE